MAATSDLQSEFSLAYVRAVAHAAGYFVQEYNRPFDNDGMDLQVMRRGAHGQTRSPRADLQVKSWLGEATTDPLPYDLGVTAYDTLRAAGFQVPRVLILVVMPRDATEWLTHSEQEIALRRCGYWVSLLGQPATENEATVRVKIPRAQVFDVPQLRGLMTRIAEERDP